MCRGYLVKLVKPELHTSRTLIWENGISEPKALVQVILRIFPCTAPSALSNGVHALCSPGTGVGVFGKGRLLWRSCLMDWLVLGAGELGSLLLAAAANRTPSAVLPSGLALTHAQQVRLGSRLEQLS